MTARVHHADLWGKRQDKYDWLDAHDVTDTHWADVRPAAPYHVFTPEDQRLREEYDAAWEVAAAFSACVVGIVTGKDAQAIGFDRDDARGLATAAALPEAELRPLLYRPFDRRWIVYDPSLVTRPRASVMRHMLAGPNLGLLTTRQTRDLWGVLAVNTLAGHKAFSAYDITSLFPLYVYGNGSLLDAAHWPTSEAGRRPNLLPAFVQDAAARLRLTFVPDGRGDLKKTFGPEDVFHWAYAVFHSPTYRSRYAPFLKIDFPRLPLTGDRELFARLCGLGAELTGLHLLAAVPEPAAGYPQPGDDVVRRTGTKAKPMYAPPTGEHPGRVYVNDAQYFEPVPPEVWAFQVGGYQVCQKWLKDRKGRTLSYEDVEHCRKVTEAIRQTIRLMAEIDDTIAGWPLP